MSALFPTKAFPLLAGLLSLAMGSVSSFAQAEKPKNTPEYREKLADGKKYAEAYEAYREALASDPDNEEILFNTGLMAYLMGKPKDAIAPWKKLKELQPEDLLVLSKLVQVYEAIGDKKARDAAREDVLKLRKEEPTDEIKDAKFYCRDQFTVGGKRLMVFEYFKLEGQRAVRYSFNIVEGDESVKSKYSLGSYETTNAIAKKGGSLKEGERMFHLDGYHDGGSRHETLAFFKGEPGYDEVKAKVVRVIEGKDGPLSSSELK